MERSAASGLRRRRHRRRGRRLRRPPGALALRPPAPPPREGVGPGRGHQQGQQRRHPRRLQRPAEVAQGEDQRRRPEARLRAGLDPRRPPPQDRQARRRPGRRGQAAPRGAQGPRRPERSPRPRDRRRGGHPPPRAPGPRPLGPLLAPHGHRLALRTHDRPGRVRRRRTGPKCGSRRPSRPSASQAACSAWRRRRGSSPPAGSSTAPASFPTRSPAWPGSTITGSSPTGANTSSRTRTAASASAMPVYPVPPRDDPGLGIHITPTLEGNIILGPSAEPVEDKRDLASTRAVAARLKAEAGPAHARDRPRPLHPQLRRDPAQARRSLRRGQVRRFRRRGERVEARLDLASSASNRPA